MRPRAQCEYRTPYSHSSHLYYTLEPPTQVLIFLSLSFFFFSTTVSKGHQISAKMSLPSHEQIADMAAHASDDLRPNIIVCVSICAFLSVMIVATRLFARFVGGTMLLLADYLIIFALVCRLWRSKLIAVRLTISLRIVDSLYPILRCTRIMYR